MSDLPWWAIAILVIVAIWIVAAVVLVALGRIDSALRRYVRLRQPAQAALVPD